MVKRLLRNSIILISLILISIIGILLIPINRPDHFLLASLDKMQRLNTLSSPKMIIIGGSNTIFNIDSKSIGDSTGYAVVNMGLHAGLGLKFPLNEIEPLVKSGDIVIIMPEYAQFFREMYYGSRIVTRLVFLDPHFFRYILDRRQFLQVIKGLGLETRSKIVFLFGHSMDEETYTRSAFNEFGDLRAELVGDRPMSNLDYDSYSIRDISEINKNAIRDLNSFYQRMSETGVNVYISLPAVPVEKYPANRQQIEDLYQYLKRDLTIPILFGPDRTLMPMADFYDTFYHLNTNGREQYTRLFLDHFPVGN